MTFYAPVYPEPTEIDAMTGYGGNYWTVPGFTNMFEENVIGLFDRYYQDRTYTWFWH